MNKAKELDQFFTKPDVALTVVQKLIDEVSFNIEDFYFIEPSAGAGSFIDATKVALPNPYITGYDIDPQREDIKYKNFLTDEFSEIEHIPYDQTFFIGNPPFGKKASLAIEFINRSLELGGYCGFILPLTLRRYFTQKLIDEKASLIVDFDLDTNIFTFQGKEYPVRCCFQLWTKVETDMPNLRRLTAPKRNHPDFDSWIYNATKNAEKFFNEDWEIAILRQGWGDFTPILKESNTELSKKKQWILIKPQNEEVKNRLLSIDYKKLAEGNTSVRGFGKADLVEEYERIFG